MKIWIDADACPLPVKTIVFRASQRVGVPVTLVANQRLQTPPSPLITAVHVSQGFDEADHYIVEQAMISDLVITDNGSGSALITLPDGSTITLTGIDFNTVDTNDFIFGP